MTDSKKWVGPINEMLDHTGTGCDLDSDIHKGFTVGTKGRTMYWERIWHSWGNVTVISERGARWLPGDTIVTLHFK